ncbi:UvrABC system protein C [Candidatus Anstonella stagnisolia]|nr:UvrABC system protein C [Candidatus Anstonella stagnisolia]
MLDISKIRIPESSGCYLFKDKSGTIIYIGKAKNLKNRVSSYFLQPHDNEKTNKLVSEIASIDFILTDNESEALLLESNLIHQHYPKYNIDLKDSERFTYIQITDEPFPRMLLVRKNRAGKVKTKGKLYGPFTGGSAYLLVASTLRKIFKIRICKRLPKKVCLQYFLGNCDAPCVGKISREEYMKNVHALEKALTGKNGLEEVVSDMKIQMHNASASLNFEKARQLRDSIRSLEGLFVRQKIEQLGHGNEDFISFHFQKGKLHVQLFRALAGVIRERKKFELEVVSHEIAIDEFLSRFYSANSIPPKIFVDALPSSPDALSEYLSKLRDGPVEITEPQKGDKKKLLELLKKNIYSEISGHADPALSQLQHELGLPALPYTIECFDISNLFGTHIVASMVQFKNAKPNKNAYRHFNIKSTATQDDFASMREVVYRRYHRLREEKAPLPDLILIDGGAAQLNAALSSLRELSLQIPCISLAKKEEEIYHPEKLAPIRLPKSSPALKVLMHARDEAHRFVISFHRKKRGKIS